VDTESPTPSSASKPPRIARTLGPGCPRPPGARCAGAGPWPAARLCAPQPASGQLKTIDNEALLSKQEERWPILSRSRARPLRRRDQIQENARTRQGKDKKRVGGKQPARPRLRDVAQLEDITQIEKIARRGGSAARLHPLEPGCALGRLAAELCGKRFGVFYRTAPRGGAARSFLVRAALGSVIGPNRRQGIWSASLWGQPVRDRYPGQAEVKDKRREIRRFRMTGNRTPT